MHGSVILAMNALRLGGSQTYALTLGALLEREGYSVTVVAKRGPLSALARSLFHVHHVHWAEGTATEHNPAAGAASIAAFAATFAPLAAKVRRPVTVIASQPWPMYHMQLVRFIWPDVRLFGLVHGFLPVEFPPPHAGHVIRRYDRFFASTLETQTFLKLRFEVDAPVLGNLFDRELFWGPGRAQLEGHAHRVLFLGTLTANKTLPLRALLAALPQMPETDLHVAGAGDELQELKQLALKLGVAERVVWCGLLPDPRDEIRAAGVVIGAGRAAIESASSGTPVVVATSDGLAGVLRPSNVERFAAANFTGRAKGRREVSPTSIQEAVVAARSMSDSDRMAVAARLDDVGDIGILLSALAGN